MILSAACAALTKRPANVDVSDLTTSARAPEAPCWLDDGSLEIPFVVEPSDAEQQLIIRRLLTASPEEEAWVGRAIDAYDALAGDTSPIANALRLLIEDRLGDCLI